MPLILNGDTGISGVDGSAGTPSLQGTDSNTGVFYATDIVGIATNGTERMRINSSGDVGIGTSSPVERLQSSRGIAATGANQSVGSLDGFVADYSSGISRMFASRNGVAAGTMAFWTTDSTGTAAERMRITSGGLVGIGTNNPQSILHIYQNTTYPTVRIDGTGTAIDTGPNIGFRCGDSSGNPWEAGYITVRNSSSNQSAGSASSFMDFYLANSGAVTVKLRINPSGTLSLQGASTSSTGVGITFPATQSASSNANTLDDYEEGTWTPTVSGTTGNPTLGYATRFGYYTKVGRVVTINCALQPDTTSVSGSGDFQITGLPFTSADLVDCVGTGVAYTNGDFNWGTNKTGIVFAVTRNTTTITVRAMQNSTTEAGIPVGNFNNSNKYLFFSLTYIAT